MRIERDEDAQVGIGTMIVFIATILVAAVAAGVLIDTSQNLQDKSTRTGNEAVNNVGTSLQVIAVYGERDLTNDGVADSAPGEALDLLKIQLRLAAGAEDLDVSKLRIQFNDGTSSGFRIYELDNGDPATDNTEFSATWLTGDGTGNILSSGELVEIQVGAADVDNTDGTAYDLQLATATSVSLAFLPEAGNEVSVGFTTPSTYGGGKIFELF